MKQLAKTLKPVLRKNKQIVDIIIFGSTTKNKLVPRDTDIAILTEGGLNRPAIKKELEEKIGKKIDLQILTLKEYKLPLWITLMREGYSVMHEKYVYELYGIRPFILYKYSLKSLTASKKVMFERAIKSFQTVKKLSNRVVLVPINISGEFSDFLKSWNIDIDAEEYGLLPLVRKEE